MGTWSHQPFGNDTAGDWAYQLENHKDFRWIDSTFDRVLATRGDIESDHGMEAVAAAEALATALGRPTQVDAYTEDVAKWASGLHSKPSAALLAKAHKVLERVLAEGSELSEDWAQSDHNTLWRRSVRTLLAALG